MTMILTGLALAFIQDQPKWDEVRSAEGNFLLWMPAKPQTQSEDKETEDGKLTIHAWVCRMNSRAYVFVYSDYPQKTLDKNTTDGLIDADLEACIRQVKGKETKRKAVTMSKHPGKAAWLETEDGRKGEVRAFLVGRRMYMIFAFAQNESFDEAEARKFIDSLKLIEE